MIFREILFIYPSIKSEYSVYLTTPLLDYALIFHFYFLVVFLTLMIFSHPLLLESLFVYWRYQFTFPFFEFYIKVIILHVVFPLNTIIMKSSMLLHRDIIHLFFLMHNIPLCDYNKIYLFISFKGFMMFQGFFLYYKKWFSEP